ncbi:MAG: nitrilase-related carbon-nitrogen hydrolase [Actinomycetes bacterium]
MSAPQVILSGPPPDSPARERDYDRGVLKVGAVQERWHPDPVEHEAALAAGIAAAVENGAQVVFLQELTLSRYFAVDPPGSIEGGDPQPEDLMEGPTFRFAAAMAYEHGVPIHASLFERSDEAVERGPGSGYNTAILVAPDGSLIQRTRKMHIPASAGYREDLWFSPGPATEAEGGGFPVVQLDFDGVAARLGLPTCWDQWFPELARAYSVADADLLAYPTAIGSEPSHPAFDTQAIWQHTIVGNGITAGLFMVAVNRIGNEGEITFYGTSFVSDPYGRVLCQAPRDEPAVLVAELDLAQRRDWLDLFPFLTTRRPDAYGSLVD